MASKVQSVSYPQPSSLKPPPASISSPSATGQGREGFCFSISEAILALSGFAGRKVSPPFTFSLIIRLSSASRFSPSRAQSSFSARSKAASSTRRFSLRAVLRLSSAPLVRLRSIISAAAFSAFFAYSILSLSASASAWELMAPAFASASIMMRPASASASSTMREVSFSAPKLVSFAICRSD